MSKVTQNFRLATLLSSFDTTGKEYLPITKEVIRDTLGVDMQSVPVYVFELKKHFKADIEAIREGRKVIAYKLKNAIKVPQFRANNSVMLKSTTTKDVGVVTKGEVPLLDGEGEVGESEMNDIKDALGLGSFGSNFSRNSYSE